MQTLQHIIEQNGPKRDTKDSILWKNAVVGSYPTKDITDKLSKSLVPSLPKSVASIVWQKFIPPRAKLAIWLANKGKLKTGDLLVEKGIITPQDASCPFCGINLESNSHILFVCRFSWSAWMEILKWWGLSAPLHNQSSKFCMQWLGLINRRKHKDIWILILGCVMWSLWYERNQTKFERKTPNLHNFVLSLKIRIGIWAKEMMGSATGAPNVIHNVESFVLQTY